MGKVGVVQYVAWFEELRRADSTRAGGKGANLGELVHAALPVPPGFVVTADAYADFLSASALAAQIEQRLTDVNVEDPARLREAAESIQRLVREAPMPDAIAAAIRAGYAELSRRAQTEAAWVAVRSSGIAEDSASASFAGMFQSFLNVHSSDELLQRVQDCWASAFGARVLYYSRKRKVGQGRGVAVVVQQMVQSEKAGVLFTADPATRNRAHIVIEAAFGLGEVVVGGQVTPDRYVVDKRTLAVVSKDVAHKNFMLVRHGETGESLHIDLAAEQADSTVLSDEEIGAVALLGRNAEAHFETPQDLEWAIEGEKVFLVQTRPITTLEAAPSPMPERKVLLHGLGASPGVASGKVRILESAAGGTALQDGEVLVTVYTAPDWVPLMRRAAAIVTDRGGMTSHAAIVSRELNIPCLVGTRDGTHVLHDGMLITVDARAGSVYEGGAPAARVTAAAAATAAPAAAPVTGTRLYVNMAEPERAEEIAALAVDGVGLLRAEFMLLGALANTHPRLLIEQGRSAEFVNKLADGARRIAAAFHPRPVVYRTTDLRTNEFRGLTGGERFEPQEANPMIGYRGAFRYTQERDLFTLELRALMLVREEFDNLHLMIPFVRTGWEFAACMEVINASGINQQRDFELWVMAEVPSIVHWLETYVRLGATGVSIGTNDLTQLMLGVDRDNSALTPLFDERDEAVLATVRQIIAECHRLGVTCSLCGQAPSIYPDYAERLVEWGIDSVSVNPDAVDITRRHIAAAEQRLVLAGARSHLAALQHGENESGS